MAWVQSFTCPPVIRKSIGRPRSSNESWSLNLLGSTPESCLRPFFAARGRLLMCPHDGRIQHQILALLVAHQLVKDPLQDAGIGPAHKALMHALVLDKTLRQVGPARSRAQYPQHAVDEKPVVSCGTTLRFVPARKKILDLLSLQITQFITVWRHSSIARDLLGSGK